MLTRDQILGLADLPRQTVEVPEWGMAVTIRAMNGTERAEFEAVAAATKKDDAVGVARMRAVIVALALCDEHGTRLFSTGEADLAAIGQKNGAALDRIALAAVALSDTRGEQGLGKSPAPGGTASSSTSPAS